MFNLLHMASTARFLFVSVNALRVLLVISSKGLLRLWCAIEVGFFGIIPILMRGSSAESESAFKYFVVQVIGSSLIIIRFCFMMAPRIVGSSC